MPELGKYAGDILAAYGITILLIVILVALSLRQSAQAKHVLETEESKALPHEK